MKIRVLIISHSSGIYGSERALLILAKNLQKSGIYDVNVTCPEMGPLVRELVHHDVRTIRLPTHSCLVTRFRTARTLVTLPLYLRNIYRAYDLFRSGDYDIVHCNTNVSLEAAVAARMLNLPVVIHARELLKDNPTNFFSGWQKSYRMVDYLATKVICVSNYLREEMLEAGCSSEKATVIYNCFEKNTSTLRQEQGNGASDNVNVDRTPVIGCVSSIRPRKGITTLVRSFAIVRRQMPDVKLRIVGGGPRSYLRHVKRLAKKLHVHEHIDFSGQVTDASPYYKNFSVFALPSYAEAFGRVYGEAGLHGLPAIGTSAGGAAEIIEDGVTGRIVPPKDSEALAQAILEILSDSELASQMGRRARERVENYFTVRHQINRVMRVYDELLFQRRKKMQTAALQ